MDNRLENTNETEKFLSRVKKFTEGEGVLVSHKRNSVTLGNLDVFESSIKSDFHFAITKKYDYCLVVFPHELEYFDDYNRATVHLFDIVKPGGFLIMYLPHKFYFRDKHSILPHDILMELKHIGNHNFDVIDFQTFGFDGAYSTQDLSRVEYAFQIILKKANNNFYNKGDLKNDDSELVDL